MSRKRIAVAATAAMLLMVLMAAPATAGNSRQTSGDFATFAEGGSFEYEVEGFARMVRTPNKTMVLVAVDGLRPGVTYGSHVHNQACADNLAGGHYSFGHAVPGGAAIDGSEIWPGPFTAGSNGKVVSRTSVGAVAGADAVSVVVHAPGGQKIACADLR